jgi:hypothetical protein
MRATPAGFHHQTQSSTLTITAFGAVTGGATKED